jgi:hypothetical protein
MALQQVLGTGDVAGEFVRRRQRLGALHPRSQISVVVQELTREKTKSGGKNGAELQWGEGREGKGKKRIRTIRITCW